MQHFPGTERPSDEQPMSASLTSEFITRTNSGLREPTYLSVVTVASARQQP
jgi:hypothetical protein